ncbi:hypothetical protein U1Q18_003050 [Sarracenia purpurea var. burkii]
MRSSRDRFTTGERRFHWSIPSNVLTKESSSIELYGWEEGLSPNHSTSTAPIPSFSGGPFSLYGWRQPKGLGHFYPSILAPRNGQIEQKRSGQRDTTSLLHPRCQCFAPTPSALPARRCSSVMLRRMITGMTPGV